MCWFCRRRWCEFLWRHIAVQSPWMWGDASFRERSGGQNNEDLYWKWWPQEGLRTGRHTTRGRCEHFHIWEFQDSRKSPEVSTENIKGARSEPDLNPLSHSTPLHVGLWAPLLVASEALAQQCFSFFSPSSFLLSPLLQLCSPLAMQWKVLQFCHTNAKGDTVACFILIKILDEWRFHAVICLHLSPRASEFLGSLDISPPFPPPSSFPNLTTTLTSHHTV